MVVEPRKIKECHSGRKSKLMGTSQKRYILRWCINFLVLHDEIAPKQHPLIVSQLCRSEVQAWPNWIPCPGFHRAQVKELARAKNVLRLCWQNSVSKVRGLTPSATEAPTIPCPVALSICGTSVLQGQRQSMRYPFFYC